MQMVVEGEESFHFFVHIVAKIDKRKEGLTQFLLKQMQRAQNLVPDWCTISVSQWVNKIPFVCQWFALFWHKWWWMEKQSQAQQSSKSLLLVCFCGVQNSMTSMWVTLFCSGVKLWMPNLSVEIHWKHFPGTSDQFVFSSTQNFEQKSTMPSKFFSQIWLWWSKKFWQQCNCTMFIAGVQNLGFVHQALDGGGIVCHKEHFFIVGQHQFSGGQCCCSVRMLFSPLVFHFIFWDMASCAQCQLLHEWMMCTPTCWWAATVVSCFLWWVHTHTCWHSAVSGDQCNCTITHCVNWSEKMIDGAVRGFFVFFVCGVTLCQSATWSLGRSFFGVINETCWTVCEFNPQFMLCSLKQNGKGQRKKTQRIVLKHNWKAKEQLNHSSVWCKGHTVNTQLQCLKWRSHIFCHIVPNFL